MKTISNNLLVHLLVKTISNNLLEYLRATTISNNYTINLGWLTGLLVTGFARQRHN